MSLQRIVFLLFCLLFRENCVYLQRLINMSSMNTTLSLENILQMLSGLSLSNRQWLAEHLVEPEELERAGQRKRDEELVRKLQALHYEGEPTTEEKKRLREIKYKYADEE